MKKNSIHDSYGRGIYVDNGFGIVVEGNVLFSVSGVNIWLKGPFSIVEVR